MRESKLISCVLRFTILALQFSPSIAFLFLVALKYFKIWDILQYYSWIFLFNFKRPEYGCWRLACRGNLRFVINSTVVELKWAVTGIDTNRDWAYCGTSSLKSFFASIRGNVHVTCEKTVRKQRKIINLLSENHFVLNIVKDVSFQ